MALFSPSASPAVTIREIDLTGVAPNVSTSTGAFVGNFRWGPVEERTLVADESGLVSTFAAPNEDNAVDFLSAAYFLKYSNTLFVVRGNNGGTNAFSAWRALRNAADSDDAVEDILVKNRTHFDNVVQSSLGEGVSQTHSGAFLARFPGALGNALSVSFCPAGDSDELFDAWDYKAQFDRAPATSAWATERNASKDEIHVAVIDRTGVFSGTPGSVLETFPHLSVAPKAVTPDGSPSYLVDVINDQSQYILASGYFGDDSAFDADFGDIGPAFGSTPDVDSATDYSVGGTWTNSLATIPLGGGTNSSDLTENEIATAFDLFEDTEQVTVDFLIAPQADSEDFGVTVVNDLVSIAEDRKDCVVVASPARDDVVGVPVATATTNTIEYANRLTNSSYLIVDNNFLKVFDKYNDNYVNIPAASSTAGLMAATDLEAAPWFSPAGQRRGNYLGVTDIAVAPNKTQRDALYKASVNPIANIPGASVVLFGDKTHENRPSAFDRINVRRLFLAIERSIAQAAKNILFEFNDEFTRAEFVNVVEPLLREIRGRRGITDFRVVCDETNNTPAVIDRNEFVASIFIKPARSINYVTLNFVAVRTGVSFDEVVGVV